MTISDGDTNDTAHNPFTAPQNANTALSTEAEEARPIWLIVFLIFQIFCYAAFVVFSGMAVVAILSGVPLRPHEVALIVMASVVSPIVAWFALLEVGSVVTPVPGRERVLARFAMWTTIVPIALAAFWGYEFFAFGHFGMNGISAMIAVAFALWWYVATTQRYLSSRKRSHRSVEEVAAEALRAASERRDGGIQ